MDNNTPPPSPNPPQQPQQKGSSEPTSEEVGGLGCFILLIVCGILFFIKSDGGPSQPSGKLIGLGIIGGCYLLAYIILKAVKK